MLLKIGFKRISSDAGVYVYERDDIRIILPIYVNDITAVSFSQSALDNFVKELASHFKLRDLGPILYLLGIEITRDRPNRTLALSQCQYILDILEHFNHSECSTVSTPMSPGLILSTSMCPKTPQDIASMRNIPYQQAVGALQYLASTTHPDIAYTVSSLTHFNSNPGEQHWKAVKHLFHYLQGTKDLKLTYHPDALTPEPFMTFMDASHGDNPDTGRSTGGYLVCMGTGAVNWSSKLQSIVTLSTTEAEYITAVEAGEDIIWMCNLLSEIGYGYDPPSSLCIDNQSALTVAKNPEHHGRLKHLDLRFYWLRNIIKTGVITPIYVSTHEMFADLLTKALAKPQIKYLQHMMGLE